MPQELINQVQNILNSIVNVLQIVATFVVAFLVLLWLTLCLWTLRDIQSRTKDILAIIFAPLLVFVLNFPGVILYLLIRPRQTLAEAYESNLQEEYMLQDLEEREICPSCHVKSQPDFMFCYNCRTRLRKECHSCGQIIKMKWNNCPFCGTIQKPRTRDTAVERAALAQGRTTGQHRVPVTTSLTRYRDDITDENGPLDTSSGLGLRRSRYEAGATTQPFAPPSLKAGYADAGRDEGEAYDFDTEPPTADHSRYDPDIENQDLPDNARYMPRSRRHPNEDEESE